MAQVSQLAILVPVLNRPHRVEPLLASIAGGTDVPHRVIFGCSDQPTVDELDRLGAWYVRDEGGSEGTWPKRINRLYEMVNESYIFTGADDLNFHPDWFQAAMRAMDRFPNSSGVVAVNDQHNQAGTHFVIARSYIQEFGASGDGPGTLMCEEYLHQYCDDEARAVAKSHDRWAVASDSIVEHMHVGAGKAPMDETYRIGEATAPQGLSVFQSRVHLWS